MGDGRPEELGGWGRRKKEQLVNYKHLTKPIDARSYAKRSAMWVHAMWTQQPGANNNM